MSKDEERNRILEMIENGLISAEEGIGLLKALAEHSQSLPEKASQASDATGITQAAPEEMPSEPVAADQKEEASDPVQETSDNVAPSNAADTQDRASSEEKPPVNEAPSPEEPLIPEEPPVEETGPDPAMQRFRNFWWIPLWVGVGITIVGATFMFLSYRAGGFGFWFACSWFPFLLGVLVLALAWGSRTARWLHVRVHQKEGDRPQNINISLPIPIRLTAWFIRTFGARIPGLQNTGVDEVIMALEKTSPNTPFYLQVNEGEDGEKVEVYIG